MSSDDDDIAGLSIVVVTWNVLLHTKMKQLFLFVSCRVRTAPNMLTRNYAFFNLKQEWWYSSSIVKSK